MTRKNTKTVRRAQGEHEALLTTFGDKVDALAASDEWARLPGSWRRSDATASMVCC